MFKKILVRAIALIVIASSTVPAVALPAKTELTIHYTRFESDYQGWNLWLWPKGGDNNESDGSNKDFFEQDFP